MVSQLSDMSSSNGEETRIALALSGGGFRATLFHLGVIRYLFETGKLQSVRYLGAVSGGSVLAAHLALHWPLYNEGSGKPSVQAKKNFDLAALELVKFIKSDVRGRIVRRWFLGWLTVVFRLLVPRHKRWTVGYLLEKQYDRLFKDGQIQHLRGDGRPKVFFNATNLTTGTDCCFSSEKFTWCKEGTEREVTTDETRIAFAVAASSAFPPLFPPVEVSYKKLKCSQTKFGDTQRLTDGGVYDNLGISRLSEISDVDLLIVSDAEGDFDTELRKSYASIVSRNIRASDLMMTRVSSLQLATLKVATQNGTVRPHSRISIKQEIDKDEDAPPNKRMTSEQQRLTAKIRTDLDRFSDGEVKSLITHGYCAARLALHKKADVLAQPAALDWDFLKEFPKGYGELTNELEKSSARKWRLFSAFDWASLVTAGILLALGYIVIDGGTWLYRQGVQNVRSAGASEVADDAKKSIASLNAEVARLQSLAKQPKPQLTTTTFQVCRGEFPSQCPAGSHFVGCGDAGAYMQANCTTFTNTQVSSRSGNQCGYSVWQVFCTKAITLPN
jgi:predicted acylesterase/phospholipase RssA